MIPSPIMSSSQRRFTLRHRNSRCQEGPPDQRNYTPPAGARGSGFTSPADPGGIEIEELLTMPRGRLRGASSSTSTDVGIPAWSQVGKQGRNYAWRSAGRPQPVGRGPNKAVTSLACSSGAGMGNPLVSPARTGSSARHLLRAGAALARRRSLRTPHPRRYCSSSSP